MKKKSLLFLSLLPLLLCSCSSNKEPSDSGKDNSPSIDPVDPVDPIDPGENEPSKEETNPMDEPYIGRQYYLNHIGDIYSSWKSYRGKGITAAVIDEGFDPNHEEFYFEDGTSKISELSASFVTQGNNVTVTKGKEAVTNLGNSHGTFCAGVVGAAINKKGIVGIAPDCNLLLLKTDLKPKSIAKAFKYAADNGAKVVTISIGSYYDYRGDLVDDGSDLGTIFDEPVKYCYDKGVVVCSAAGNGGLDNLPNEYTFPGCVDNVIGVGGLAANSSEEIWTGSSYNSSSQYQFVDCLAPADMMFGCCHYDNKKYDGGWNGTSFASPIVAGLAALYFEKNPSKTASNFEKDLYSSCHKLTSSNIATSDQLGAGRVDVAKLLNISNNEKAKVNLEGSWANCYAYIWNSNTGVSLSSWPGNKLEKNNNIYSYEVDLSKYDSIIFTSSSNGPQTVDLLASSFIYGDIYSINSSITELGKIVGNYR